MIWKHVWALELPKLKTIVAYKARNLCVQIQTSGWRKQGRRG